MKTRDVMHPAEHVVTRVDSLAEAVEVMRTHGVRYLPVVDDGRLVGILTERDVLEYRATLGFDQEWRDHGVSGAMTRAPRTATPEDPVADVAERLARGRFGALPVVEDGVLVGIVAIGDVIAADLPRPAGARPRRVVAADAMTPGPFTTHPDEGLFEAARRMRVHGIRHLPVVDRDDHVVGMLSERDLRSAVGDPARFVLTAARTEQRVRDAMSALPYTVTENRPLVEIAKVFEDGRIGAVPVLDRQERLVGIVSYVDVLHALAGG
jgi:acetoin utilization protein AcuB